MWRYNVVNNFKYVAPERLIIFYYYSYTWLALRRVSQQLCDGNEEVLNFIKTVRQLSNYGCSDLWGVGKYNFLNGIRWYCPVEPFLSILCDTLFRSSKLVFIIFEPAGTWRFLYMKDNSISCNMQLKLLDFKSVNVVWHSLV